MAKTILASCLLFLLGFSPVSAELGSLSHLFLPGKALRDTDGDGLVDKVGLVIVIPDNPTAAEIALAADIAARANLESLAQDMALVRRESELPAIDRLENAVILGTNVRWLREAIKAGEVACPPLGPLQGAVIAYSTKSQGGLALAAGSEDAFLQAGRAFFLRWPYFWDVWGREEGPTYDALERDITRFLSAEGVGLQRTIVRSALYEFPPLDKGSGALKSLRFGNGEIADLRVEIHVTDEEDLDRSAKAFEALAGLHLRGQRTDVLGYAGCGRLSVVLRYGKTSRTAALPRIGKPKRMLTPVFKDAPRPAGPGKDFDLLTAFSTRGFYGDVDRDGAPDALNARIVLPEGGSPRAAAGLASRMVLDTAGASFPTVVLDREIEAPKALLAPLLVGSNALVRELERVGKLKPAALDPGCGSIRVVPRAFGASNALAVRGADATGLEKTLAYLVRTFPFLDRYEAGRPRLADAADAVERFLKGEGGAAEAYVTRALKKTLADLKDKNLESLEAELVLPKPNPRFEEDLKKALAAAAPGLSPAVRSTTIASGRPIFEKEKTFPWEGDEAVRLVREALASPARGAAPLRISLGLSESPEVRRAVRERIEALLPQGAGPAAEVEVLSSYKPGFFWLTERVAPLLKGKPVAQLVIRFPEEGDDPSKPKRFYAEPSRWLQELYPVDEILARETGLPLDRIRFEMAPPGGAAYEVAALDARGAILVQQSFAPRVRELPYLRALPEWGTVKLTTGWLRIESGGTVIADEALPSDLERLWAFYQDEVLGPLTAHVLRKTGGEPTFAKQPYFKQLRVEIWSSEPDFRLGLDEENVSSLEALHDEIYFDTLDLLRGLTAIDVESDAAPEDTQRFSAPGNVLPVIHPSTEGAAPKIKVAFEDWAAPAPQLSLKWKERGREEAGRRIVFPSLKSKPLRVPELVYDGRDERIASLAVELEFDRESDYLALLDVLAEVRGLLDKGLVASPLALPGLDRIDLVIRTKDLEKTEALPVASPAPGPPAPAPLKAGAAPIVDPARIYSPEMVLEAAARLGATPPLRGYIGGRSYEGRPVPVLEAFKPAGPYVSIPRLTALKPTLYLVGRQHANEVSSTTYLLKLAELLAGDRTTQDFLNKVNVVLHPLENPDGAALAYELQALTPFHSLHAGRYSSLGLEIGAAGTGRPILPEALVRRDLVARWQPDILLNLHGYPSHEWVQPFSGYVPYLFRDYWIPKGWFAYLRALTHPLFDRYKEAGEAVAAFIVAEMQADERIKDSNRRFYDRYRRWASAWQPHLAYLELHDGLDLYLKRRSSQENRLSPRNQVTYVEETPELMDETARGAWLDFLSTQGLAYIKAHLKYLSQAKFEVARLEEEVQERIRIQFLRRRPGSAPR